MKTPRSIIFSLVLFGAVSHASAATQWAVSDTALTNCNNSAHGLWTHSLNPSSSACSNYFSFDSNASTLTEFNDGTAVLDATAYNPDNIQADISITFDDYSTTFSPVQEDGGAEQSSWYFYQSITSGSITINGLSYHIDIHGNYAFQIGDGANDKTSAFGASTWLDATYNGGAVSGGNPWDFNIDLTPVPLPAAAWLFGSALLGFAGIARNKKNL